MELMHPKAAGLILHDQDVLKKIPLFSIFNDIDEVELLFHTYHTSYLQVYSCHSFGKAPEADPTLSIQVLLHFQAKAVRKGPRYAPHWQP